MVLIDFLISSTVHNGHTAGWLNVSTVHFLKMRVAFLFWFKYFCAHPTEYLLTTQTSYFVTPSLFFNWNSTTRAKFSFFTLFHPLCEQTFSFLIGIFVHGTGESIVVLDVTGCAYICLTLATCEHRTIGTYPVNNWTVWRDAVVIFLLMLADKHR